MNKTLKEQLARSMFRFRKVVMILHTGFDMSMGEIAVMNGVAEKATGNEKNMCVSDIQNNLHITKPAVSQIYSALEKKGYIIREIDTNDRRKILVTLTPKGQEVLKAMKVQSGKMLDDVISRLGEADTRHLIELFNRLVDISDDIKQERTKMEHKEEDFN